MFMDVWEEIHGNMMKIYVKNCVSLRTNLGKQICIFKVLGVFIHKQS